MGAGLPIINTISDLINSGDRIIKIEAVVSGTLNFIFNEMSATVPMSRAIRMAQEAGYAEPDPRVDLSGTDVIRKLVILSREAGYRVEQAMSRKSCSFPRSISRGRSRSSGAGFPRWTPISSSAAGGWKPAGLRWRFVACMENGRTEVSLREVDSESPFYHLGRQQQRDSADDRAVQGVPDANQGLRSRGERDCCRRVRRHHQHRQYSVGSYSGGVIAAGRFFDSDCRKERRRRRPSLRDGVFRVR